MIPRLDARLKLPFPVPFKGGHLHAAGKIVARNLHDIVQRALDAVEDAADKPWPELNAHRLARRFHRRAGAEARRLFINLNRCTIPVHLDYFTNQALVAYPHHVEHIRVPHSLRDDKRPGHLDNRPCAHGESPHFFIIR